MQLCSRQAEQEPALTKAGGAKQMSHVNQWLSYGYGPFTLTVRYGDLQTLNLAPQEPAQGTAPTFNTALTVTASLPSSYGLALSPRQREVLELIVLGLPNKEIARRLDLAVGTVKIHVAVLFLKMNVTSRTAAAVAGARLLAASPPQLKAAA
jgi:DNA-binding CsgD family transcriptional regulator